MSVVSGSECPDSPYAIVGAKRFYRASSSGQSFSGALNFCDATFPGTTLATFETQGEVDALVAQADSYCKHSADVSVQYAVIFLTNVIPS